MGDSDAEHDRYAFQKIWGMISAPSIIEYSCDCAKHLLPEDSKLPLTAPLSSAKSLLLETETWVSVSYDRFLTCLSPGAGCGGVPRPDRRVPPTGSEQGVTRIGTACPCSLRRYRVAGRHLDPNGRGNPAGTKEGRRGRTGQDCQQWFLCPTARLPKRPDLRAPRDPGRFIVAATDGGNRL